MRARSTTLSPAAGRAIVVYGATGTLGRQVVAALAERGAHVIAAGRDAARVGAIADELGVTARAAAIDDRAGLAEVVAGARVVVACAGPYAEVGEPILAAAIAGGAAYVDACGEQGFLRAAYERYESAARRAGVACVGGMGVAPALGDLAAARAAELLRAGDRGREPRDDDPGAGAILRAAAPGRVGEDDPLDELDITWILDGVAAAPGAQRSGVEALAGGGVIWNDGRWDAAPPGAARRELNAGPEHGGLRVAISAPGGEVITVPRHLGVRRVQTFASVARSPLAMRAASLAARAVPLLGAGVAARLRKLAPAPPPTERERARARFAVIAQARHRFETEEVRVGGADVYASAAAIAAWAAVALAARQAGPVGVLAPAEVFAPGPALAALAAAADLDVVIRSARA